MIGRVACISHGSIVALNRRPFDLLAGRHGLDVTVIVPDRWTGNVPDPDLRPQQTTGGARLLPLPAIRSGNGSLFVLRGLRRALRDVAPTHILLDEEPWSVVAWQVLGAAGDTPLCFYSKQNIAKRTPPPFSWVRRRTYRRARSAWAVGRTTAEVLVATGYRGPVTIVPHGVEISRFGPGVDEERRGSLGLRRLVVGYVGRLVPEKGIRELLEALQLLARDPTCPEFSLCAVGGGPLAPLLAEAGANGPLSGRVVALGPVPHESAPDVFRLMDVVVLPSRTTPDWCEQFGRVLVEAAACGLPLVGTDSGEIPHVIRDLGGGQVVPEGDVAALSAAIGRYLGDDADRERAGRTNLDAARTRYSQEAVAERMLALLGDMA